MVNLGTYKWYFNDGLWMQEIVFNLLFIKLVLFLKMLLRLQDGDSDRDILFSTAKLLVMQRESTCSLTLQREFS